MCGEAEAARGRHRPRLAEAEFGIYYGATLALYIATQLGLEDAWRQQGCKGCPAGSVTGSCCSRHARCRCRPGKVSHRAALSSLWQRGFGGACHNGPCARDRHACPRIMQVCRLGSQPWQGQSVRQTDKVVDEADKQEVTEQEVMLMLLKYVAAGGQLDQMRLERERHTAG